MPMPVPSPLTRSRSGIKFNLENKLFFRRRSSLPYFNPVSVDVSALPVSVPVPAPYPCPPLPRPLCYYCFLHFVVTARVPAAHLLPDDVLFSIQRPHILGTRHVPRLITQPFAFPDTALFKLVSRPRPLEARIHGILGMGLDQIGCTICIIHNWTPGCWTPWGVGDPARLDFWRFGAHCAPQPAIS